MRKENNIEQVLTWDTSFGVFKAIIRNDSLAGFCACEQDSVPTLNSSNLPYLVAVRNAINDLLTEMTKINEKNNSTKL